MLDARSEGGIRATSGPGGNCILGYEVCGRAGESRTEGP